MYSQRNRAVDLLPNNSGVMMAIDWRQIIKRMDWLSGMKYMEAVTKHDLTIDKLEEAWPEISQGDLIKFREGQELYTFYFSVRIRLSLFPQKYTCFTSSSSTGLLSQDISQFLVFTGVWTTILDTHPRLRVLLCQMSTT